MKRYMAQMSAAFVFAAGVSAMAIAAQSPTPSQQPTPTGTLAPTPQAPTTVPPVTGATPGPGTLKMNKG